MFSPISVMAVGTLIGVAALLLITKELASRLQTGPGGKIAFAIFLGMGVLTIVAKTVGLYIVENNLPALRRTDHPVPTSTVRLEWSSQSSLTAPWQSLAQIPAAQDKPAMIALGQVLFSDRRLSSDGSISCASCHVVGKGGDDGQPVSTGIGRQKGSRNAPSVLSAALLSRQFWDGRAASLEEQAHGPILNPIEMGMSDPASVNDVLAADSAYVARFREVFGDGAAPTLDRAADALAAYERTLVPETRYDRFVAGDPSALSEREQRGMALFAGLGCRECHRDPTFSSAGLIQPAGVFKPFPVFSDDPRQKIYNLRSDLGAARSDSPTGLWRAPSLRNVGQSSPYFHNGSVLDLREAIRVMLWAQLGRKKIRPGAPDILRFTTWTPKTKRMKFLRPEEIYERDVDDIYLFLMSLSPVNSSEPVR